MSLPHLIDKVTEQVFSQTSYDSFTSGGKQPRSECCAQRASDNGQISESSSRDVNDYARKMNIEGRINRTQLQLLGLFPRWCF